MKKNKGYTLVELIIVLAIMAILSGLSVVSMGIINQAKYTAAANKFSDEIGALLVKTKAVSQAKQDVLTMIIEQQDDKSYSLLLGTDQDADGKHFTMTSELGTLTKIISINYKNASGVEKAAYMNSNSKVKAYIQFNKSDGSVRYGAGDYEIIYNGNVVATVHLDGVTGNHFIK